MNTDNLILATDSYKLNHWYQYPPNTQRVYSYMESRIGAAHPATVFFGLQYLLKKYFGRVSWDDLQEASNLSYHHLGPQRFNHKGWSRLLEQHGGLLPLRIKAVPEGTVVPTGNVLLTVENTDPEFGWLTNYVESLLMHVWYPTTVATRSYFAKKELGDYLDMTAQGHRDGLDFMLHDFGFRGASSHETAGIGGLAHLVNFKGTDTLPALIYGMQYYDANAETLGFSVPATEHSVMTAMGEDGEYQVLKRLLEDYPDGVLSVVNDSYNYQRHVNWLCTDFREAIMNRDGVFVTRPDSVAQGETPASVCVWIAKRLWKAFGGTVNVQGNKVLDPHIRILWGDGIEMDGIRTILNTLAMFGFSAENMVFGMGGGLLQKVNRDTERFSIKSSAQERDGVWYDIAKNAPGKKSKKGKLMLLQRNGTYETVSYDHVGHGARDILETVYEDGKLVKEISFDEVRQNAAEMLPVMV